MKNLVYSLTALTLFSCGGSGDSSNQESVDDSLYGDDHEWIVSAKELKEKLGDFQASFLEIGNKEVEETICEEGEAVTYTGNKNEMNIWMMATYMLDNFSDSTFGKNDFKMPNAIIREEVPLRDLNWLNFNDSDSAMFNLYKQYPDLTNVPKKVKGEDGVEVSNDEMAQCADKILKALKDGLFVVIAITDYLPPKFTSATEFETGHVMGYIMFADWESGQLSCLSPLLAQNSSEINFDNLDGMKSDLKAQTYNNLDSIAKSRTGFTGPVSVNNAANLEKYKANK